MVILIASGGFSEICAVAGGDDIPSWNVSRYDPVVGFSLSEAFCWRNEIEGQG
jgi:hypothetical protein